MRTTCRFILAIAVFVAAAGFVSAQQPDPPPPPAPVPETQATPVPPPPDAAPPMAETTPMPVLKLVPVAPEPVVPSTARPVKKATASRKQIEKPAPPMEAPQAKEAAAAAAGVAATGSWTPPPAGTGDVPAAASPNLAQKAPVAVDPAVQAEMDKTLADAARSKKRAGGWIVLGLGGLALLGLAVYFVRTRNGVTMVPPIFEDGPPVQALAVASVSIAPARSGPDRLS